MGKAGLESESLEVWKAAVESFPNNNAKLTQHYCRKCPLFSPRPAGVHASPGLGKLENNAPCAASSMRWWGNLLGGRMRIYPQTPPVSEVSSEHPPEQNNHKYHYHYHHYHHHYH